MLAQNSPFVGTGSAPSISANRVSYVFGLIGLSLTVDTACSASLTAFDISRSFVVRGPPGAEALSLGVNAILSALPFMPTSASHMLAVLGRCTTFDASASGYV